MSDLLTIEDLRAGYELAKKMDFEKNKIVWLEPANANNTWAIAIRKDVASANHLKTLEDLGRWVSAGGKFNEGQGKAAGFTDRMLQSEAILSGKAPETGIGPVTPGADLEGTSLSARGISKVPLVGNFAVGEDYQKYNQAKSDFINAQLRRESGAAIAPSEFASAEAQYFPKPGDSQKVIEQKRANRRAAVTAMGREGGPSYRPEATYREDGALASTKPRIAPAQAPQAAQGGALAAARDAIARGADPNAVRQRLQQNGIDPSGL